MSPPLRKFRPGERVVWRPPVGWPNTPIQSSAA